MQNFATFAYAEKKPTRMAQRCSQEKQSRVRKIEGKQARAMMKVSTRKNEEERKGREKGMKKRSEEIKGKRGRERGKRRRGSEKMRGVSVEEQREGEELKNWERGDLKRRN